MTGTRAILGRFSSTAALIVGWGAAAVLAVADTLVSGSMALIAAPFALFLAPLALFAVGSMLGGLGAALYAVKSARVLGVALKAAGKMVSHAGKTANGALKALRRSRKVLAALGAGYAVVSAVVLFSHIAGRVSSNPVGATVWNVAAPLALVVVPVGAAVVGLLWWKRRALRLDPRRMPLWKRIAPRATVLSHITIDPASEEATQRLHIGDAIMKDPRPGKPCQVLPAFAPLESTLIFRVAGPGVGKTTGDLATALIGPWGPPLPGWDGAGAGFRPPAMVVSTAADVLNLIRAAEARLRAAEPGISDDELRDRIAVWSNDDETLMNQELANGQAAELRKLVLPYLRAWNPLLHIDRRRTRSVAAQAQQLAEAAVGTGDTSGNDAATFFRGEVVPILTALYTAGHWAGFTSMNQCAQWVDQIAPSSDPSVRRHAMEWLEATLTMRSPDPEVGDPGTSDTDLDLWSAAQSKLATVLQDGAASQGAGTQSTLAQIVAAWRDLSVTALDTWEIDGFRVSRPLDMAAMVAGPYRLTIVLANGEATKLAKTTSLVKQFVDAMHDVALTAAKAGGQHGWAAHLDEFESLMSAPALASWVRQDRKHNFTYCAYTQSVKGLEATLGKDDAASVLSAADFLIVGSKLGLDNGLWALGSRLLGKVLQVQASVSRGDRSTSESEGHQLTELADEQMLFAAVGAGQQLVLPQEHGARNGPHEVLPFVSLQRPAFVGKAHKRFRDLVVAERWTTGNAGENTYVAQSRPRQSWQAHLGLRRH